MARRTQSRSPISKPPARGSPAASTTRRASSRFRCRSSPARTSTASSTTCSAPAASRSAARATRCCSCRPSSAERGVIAASAGNHAQGIALPREPARHSDDRRDAGVRRADQGDQLPPVRRERRSCTAPTSPRRAPTPARSPRATASRSSIRSTTPHVIAGQGTMGLEILEQTPDVEAIVVPVGGGGLIAGIGIAVKAKAPRRR